MVVFCPGSRPFARKNTRITVHFLPAAVSLSCLTECSRSPLSFLDGSNDTNDNRLGAKNVLHLFTNLGMFQAEGYFLCSRWAAPEEPFSHHCCQDKICLVPAWLTPDSIDGGTGRVLEGAPGGGGGGGGDFRAYAVMCVHGTESYEIDRV